MELEMDDAGAISDNGQDEWEDAEVHEDDPDPVSPSLHPEDVSNFLKLSNVLRIFLSDSLTDAAISEADSLIREYGLELIKVGPPSP